MVFILLILNFLLYYSLPASDIINCIIKHLSKVDLWTEDFIEISNLLQQCINIANRWITSCKELTEIFWPNYSLHLWSGDPYIPENLVNLLNKLKELLNVRLVHRQLVRLLTVSEQEDLKAEDIFKPFKGENYSFIFSENLSISF